MQEPGQIDGSRNDADWAPPLARSEVAATVCLPGSKSMTNRALIIAAIADTPTTIVGPLQARDTDLMTGAIVALGATVEPTGPDRNSTARSSAADADGAARWTVTPGRVFGRARVDVGNAGTVLRFVPPLAGLQTADVEFTGDPRAAERPVAELLAGLRQAGMDIDDDGRGAVPFVVRGRGQVRGGAVALDASASSQLISGLLVAAPRFDDGVEVTHRGDRVPSAQHIAMTAAMLTAAGADVEAVCLAGDGGVPDFWRVRPGRLTPGTIAIEPDLSNAAPFLAAALVTGGRVTVAGWPATSLQAADQILDVLAQMGARWERDRSGVCIQGGGTIHGIKADVRDVNELAPVLTALAALADSPSELLGIGHMRMHETDRLAALVGEIGALGGHVTELPDGLRVEPRPLRAGAQPFDSHDDHRMVMAAAVLGLAVPGLRIHNAATVAKTFPQFQVLWQQILGQAP
jgi:3-phosphoshikimate 1-carboxyvinyltransferase